MDKKIKLKLPKNTEILVRYDRQKLLRAGNDWSKFPSEFTPKQRRRIKKKLIKNGFKLPESIS